MTEETLDRFFERLEEWFVHSRRPGSVKIIWHGGEPLSMPVSFFYRALDWQDRLAEQWGRRIENNIQSNLLCLDAQRVEMLKRLLDYNGELRTVGTSYDPVPGVRVLKGGDYNARWQEAVSMLQDNGFPFGIVYVVHRLTLERLEEVTGVFTEKYPGIGVRFNPLYKEGKAARQGCRPLYITPLEWGDFLVRLYGIWDTHDKKPGWQPLKEWEHFHHGRDSRLSCDLAGKCGTTHVGVDTDGTVYCCGRGIDRAYRPYGNLHQIGFRDMLSGTARRELVNRPVFLQRTRCSGCKWWRYCHGGCPMDAAIHHKNDIYHKSNVCLARLRFLQTIYKEPGR